MNQMRRFVDVIFVQPKKKYYVVLHQGNFWRLPRLNLTISSWEVKTPYLGSLEDIYVSKNQVIDCEKLAAVLDTQPLPEELHGLSAHRFLDWWSMYDYEWLAKKSLKASTQNTTDTIQAHPSTPVRATTQSQRTALSASPNPPERQAVAPVTPAPTARPMPTATPTAVTSNPATPRPVAPNPVASNPAPANPAVSTPKPATPSPNTHINTQTATTAQAPIKKPAAEGFDIFDSLLQELNEEVQHLNQKH